MSNNLKRQVIQSLAEQRIPANYDAWEAVKARLVVAPNRQGEEMETIKRRRMVLAAYATLIIAALLTSIFATPQGRAFAQSILQFFARADRDRYPLQAWQMTPPAPTSSESPFKYSVQDAEALAGYDVSSPAEPPFGMMFVGASYDEKYHVVAQAFGLSSDSIAVSIWQQPLAYYEPCGDISKRCDNMLGSNLAGLTADIQTVRVGNTAGEYVEGVWNLTDNGPVWEPTPYLKTLRWKTDTMIFELVGGIDQTREDLVNLAESLR